MTIELKIVDKVKFWEEQDKINELLIPRVLDIHEQLKSISLLAQQNSSNYLQAKQFIDALESQVQEIASKTEKQIRGMQNHNNDLQNRVQALLNLEQDFDIRYKGLFAVLNEHKEFLEKECIKQSDEIGKCIEHVVRIQQDFLQLSKDNEVLLDDINKKQEVMLDAINKNQDSTDGRINNAVTKLDILSSKTKNLIVLSEQQNKEIQDLSNSIKKYSDKIKVLSHNFNQSKNELLDKSNKNQWITIIALVLSIIALIVSVWR